MSNQFPPALPPKPAPKKTSREPPPAGPTPPKQAGINTQPVIGLPPGEDDYQKGMQFYP